MCSTECICGALLIPRLEDTFASAIGRLLAAPARRPVVGPYRRRVDGVRETVRFRGSPGEASAWAEGETTLGLHDRRCDSVRTPDRPRGGPGDRRDRLGHRPLWPTLVVIPSIRGGFPSSRCRPSVYRIAIVHRRAFLTGKYVYSKLPEERPLLERGPYRYIRHPIYLSFLLTSVGFVFLAANIVMLPLLFALTAIRYPKREEPELIRLYGDVYREYQSRTGRFLPKLRRG